MLIYYYRPTVNMGQTIYTLCNKTYKFMYIYFFYKYIISIKNCKYSLKYFKPYITPKKKNNNIISYLDS
jgi:hypothetical protein